MSGANLTAHHTEGICTGTGPVTLRLAEVRDAAGHANVSITSTYLHVAVEDQAVGNLFLFA